jgi:serpin B
MEPSHPHCFPAPFLHHDLIIRTFIAMRNSFLLLLLLIFSSFAFQGSAPLVVSKEVQQIAANNNEFAFELYDQLSEKEGNMFFSPFSVSSALAMTYAGSDKATATEMANIMHFSENQPKFHTDFESYLKALKQNNKEVILRYANRIWVQKNMTIEAPFKTICDTHYNAEVALVDFIPSREREKSRFTINDWVAKQTEQKILNLIPKGILTEATRLVLTNAIYFKGNWAQKFDEKLTRDRVFSVSKDATVKVPFMWQNGMYRYALNPEAQLIELPYEGAGMSMVLVLPQPGKTIKGWDTKGLASWINTLQLQGVQEVNVTFPKFKFTKETRLKTELQSMGMNLPFSPAADFSKMTKEEQLYISAVIHKAFVEVNEDGTEAAAATAVVMKDRVISKQGEPPTFNANRPFVFVIKDNATGSILFMGRVSNPLL